MCRVLHKCIFEILGTNNFGVRFFLQFVLEVDVQFFLINQSDYGNKPTYLSVSKIVSPIFWLELQPVFSLLLSLPLNRITHQHTTLTTMSLSESEKKPDMPSLPIARKQSDSNAFTATPFPMKDCGSKLSFVDNEPPSKALKTTIPHSSSPNHPRPSPLPHKNKSCGHSLFIVASSSSSKYSPPHSPHYHRPFIDYNHYQTVHGPFYTKKITAIPLLSSPLPLHQNTHHCHPFIIIALSSPSSPTTFTTHWFSHLNSIWILTAWIYLIAKIQNIIEQRAKQKNVRQNTVLPCKRRWHAIIAALLPKLLPHGCRINATMRCHQWRHTNVTAIATPLPLSPKIRVGAIHPTPSPNLPPPSPVSHKNKSRGHSLIILAPPSPPKYSNSHSLNLIAKIQNIMEQRAKQKNVRHNTVLLPRWANWTKPRYTLHLNSVSRLIIS